MCEKPQVANHMQAEDALVADISIAISRYVFSSLLGCFFLYWLKYFTKKILI